MGHVSASPRLAAHQSGRAIAAVSSKVDRGTRGVKYVATVETVPAISAHASPRAKPGVSEKEPLRQSLRRS